MKMLVGSLIEATRRNHALEHATLHVLEEVDASSRLAGRSDWSGFWIYGEVGTGELASAAEEALTRLNDGENRLAIHPPLWHQPGCWPGSGRMGIPGSLGQGEPTGLAKGSLLDGGPECSSVSGSAAGIPASTEGYDSRGLERLAHR